MSTLKDIKQIFDYHAGEFRALSAPAQAEIERARYLLGCAIRNEEHHAPVGTISNPVVTLKKRPRKRAKKKTQ